MKNFKTVSKLILGAFALMIVLSLCKTTTVYAADEAVTAEAVAAEDSTIPAKAIGASIAIGLAALGGALAMGIAISKSSEGIARQPEAEGKIRTTLMLGLVFIETAIIYALIVAILVIFVL